MSDNKELEDLLRREELEDLRAVAKTDSGRRVLWRVIGQAQVFGTCFSLDPFATAFNEGQRNMGLMLLNDLLAVAPEAFTAMQRAAKEREEHGGRATRLDDNGDNGDGGNAWH